MFGSAANGAVERLAAVAAVGDGPRRGIGTIVLASVHIHSAVRQFDRHAFVRMERIVGRVRVDRAKLPGSCHDRRYKQDARPNCRIALI